MAISAARKYSDDDYGTCRYIFETRTNNGTWQGSRVAINETAAILTIARAKRVCLLNLIDDDVNAMVDGHTVKLSGLGEKTAEEAIRLGIAAITAPT